MAKMALTLDRRTETGTGPNYRLRSTGRIPAVIYGGGNTAEKASIDYREFETLMKRADAEKAILTVTFDGSDTSAVIREIQRDPVTRRYLHIDLYRIRMDVKAVFKVAVHTVGTAAGIREGGILETHLRSLEVRCLPADLPSAINVDITALKVNQSMHASDAVLPEGVTLVTAPSETLFTVLAPKAEVVAAAEPVAAVQPEVIGKKKEEPEKEKEKEKK